MSTYAPFEICEVCKITDITNPIYIFFKIFK